MSDMSTYTDEVDGCNVICPYCKHEYQPEAETYSEDTVVETCDECGKKFHRHDNFNIDHHTTPDCQLQGLKHVWVMRKLRGDMQHEFCSVCDKCKPVTR